MRATYQRVIKTVSDEIAQADWNFRNAETDYLTHGIHRYSGKFIPQIASQAIELLSSPGETVLDLYCGSGTTLVEAALHSRRAIGIDLNPLAVLISRVKTTPVDEATLKSFSQDLIQFVLGNETADLFSDRPRSRDDQDWRMADPWFSKWFQKPVLRDLVIIFNEIEQIDDLKLRNIAMVAFSDVLRRSSNAHQGYPNVMFDKRLGARPRPGKYFVKALKQICDSVASLNKTERAQWAGISVIEGDAEAPSIESSSVDAVITHPPYVGSVPYAEYGALSLKWLGRDPKQIDKMLTGGRRQSSDVIQRFTVGYKNMIASSYRALKAGRYFFALVGNPTVKGQVIDLSNMTTSLAVAEGFVPVAIATRSAENRRANKMGDESVMVFIK